VNAYAILILAALIAEYLLNVAADLLNLKALEPELPSEFSDVYDAERYRKSQEYTRARTRFGLIPATFHLVVLLTFWFAGGFPWLDGIARPSSRPS
jgi:STE24 endopeptidase